MGRARKLVLTGIVGAAAVGLAFVYWPAAPAATNLRSVVVISGQAPASPDINARLCGAFTNCRNGAGGTEVVFLLDGAAPPAGPTDAVVLTDVDCAPDSYGISHCHNKLRLASGAVIEVRHDHNMHLYPCLEPGERVRVLDATQS